MDKIEHPTLQQYIKKRNGYRTVITTCFSNIERIVNDVSISTDQQINNSQGIIQTIKKEQSRIEELDLMIEDLLLQIEEDSVYHTDLLERAQYHSDVCSKIISIENHIETTRNANVHRSNQQLTHHQSFAILPKLNLPTFNGDIFNWKSFWDTFEVEIHNNNQYPNVTKYNYLKGLLTGEAQTVIAGLSATNENYEKAIILLKEEYGNENEIIKQHLKSLINLPSVNTIIELKTMYKTLEQHIRALEAMNVQSDQYGIILTYSILNKISRDLGLTLPNIRSKRHFTLNELREAIKLELQSNYITNDNEMNHSPQHILLSTQNLKNSYCHFCKDKTHNSKDCEQYPTSEKRIEYANSIGLCLNCLKKDHKTVECKNKYSCYHCQERHHTSLHLDERKFTKDESSVNIAQNKKPELVGLVGTTLTESLEKTYNVLPTATATIAHEKIQCTANILFDTGSQCTFITRQKINELKLIPQFKVIKALQPLNHPAVSKSYDIVKFQLIGEGKPIIIEAIVLPYIATLNVPSTKDIIAQYPQLKNVKLAMTNSQPSTFPIDILIGCDQLYKLTNNEPLVIKTTIGHVVGGVIRKSSLRNTFNTNVMIDEEYNSDDDPELKARLNRSTTG